MALSGHVGAVSLFSALVTPTGYGAFSQDYNYSMPQRITGIRMQISISSRPMTTPTLVLDVVDLFPLVIVCLSENTF